MRFYKLPEKVFNIKGNAAAFLNGLTSNVLEAPLNAFLNQHGRIIATFRQHRLSDEELAISVPEIAQENLLKHLERYARLSRVSITPGGQSIYLDLDKADFVWSLEQHTNNVSEEEFTLCRLTQNIPLMGIDYQADEFVLNVHEYNYTSYTKGCFLGQEPVAKVHNRSRPTRQLIVQFEDQCPPEDAAKMTSKAKDPGTGRVRGFVFVSHKPA